MDNSNENTQNPKENQEKMADEGIQKHSEHTAENKQPESKDNVLNKDESTCLCKFFKKIAEWICARKNKNSNKADENAAKNNDAAKQEEIKQTDTVEQPKEQRKLSDYLGNSNKLESISKLLGISAVFGTLLGGTITYIYLKNIGQLSIFPELATNASSLITISIWFGFQALLIYLVFFITDFTSLIIINSNLEKYEKIISLLIGGTIIGAIILFIVFILEPPSSNDLEFIGLFFLYIACIFILSFLLKNKKYEKFIYFFINFCALIILISVILLSNKIGILSFFHFIETKQDSSWYLLHNNFQQNNGSQETNGIDKNDLLKLKQKFKCSALSETEKKEKEIECSPHFEQRNNALYGFMAWNLGDTKVFCPPTVNNTIEDEEQKKKLGKECIIISGKALQIMPESYISTDTDGIDDGNPDNTGHDEPAIDINTDVRFKNDLNAQSNAGLNNFNVQPVLPIQSNAKNMSIQIHYGSCNHDSPRNKDGHPDIGYTDKKICQ